MTISPTMKPQPYKASLACPIHAATRLVRLYRKERSGLAWRAMAMRLRVTAVAVLMDGDDWGANLLMEAAAVCVDKAHASEAN